MSKKNNRKTRANLHRFDLQREKQEIDKRKKKQDRQEVKAKAEEAMAVLENMTVSQSSKKSGASILSGALKTQGKKLKRKAGPRVRKNAVVRGIKIKGAESKQKVREILAEEKAMKMTDE